MVLYLLERNVSVDETTTDGLSALSLVSVHLRVMFGISPRGCLMQAIVGLGSIHDRMAEESEQRASSGQCGDGSLFSMFNLRMYWLISMLKKKKI